jgi:hypothetical protein
MRGPQQAIDSLDADLASIRQGQLLELALDDLESLLRESDTDPFTPRTGPYRTGLDDLALTLSAAERLPDELTVRILLPPGTAPTVPIVQAQAALRRHASDAASAAWRDAMAVRSMGRRQVPIGAPIAGVSAVIAYGAAYLATVADSAVAEGLLVVVAMIAITVAWVTSWMVFEAAVLDWRQTGRKADAYDLLACATLDVVVNEPNHPSGSSTVESGRAS